ncbi:hypothetical protein DBV15_11581 [Temnothorax longispinosus]|uniref:Uncharacterized protein n=1 Tax=Temnothorax longispinosus TaxID=300112 RepID=A0A4V3SCX4_9HYME|nr:hypothetical protein DBV15_11581 [Temnothorax longispinosus]
MVKADGRHEKVIELRHSQRLPAFVVPFTRIPRLRRDYVLNRSTTVCPACASRRDLYSPSHLSLFAPRLFTWQQQRGVLSLPAKIARALEDSLATKAARDCTTTDLHKHETYILCSARTHVTPTSPEVVRRLCLAGEKGSPFARNGPRTLSEYPLDTGRKSFRERRGRRLSRRSILREKYSEMSNRS